MSAPQTNLEKQRRRHRGPLIGIIVVLLFVGIMFMWLTGRLGFDDTGRNQNGATLQGQNGEDVQDTAPAEGEAARDIPTPAAPVDAAPDSTAPATTAPDPSAPAVSTPGTPVPETGGTAPGTADPAANGATTPAPTSD